jgi:hypothetical protein
MDFFLITLFMEIVHIKNLVWNMCFYWLRGMLQTFGHYCNADVMFMVTKSEKNADVDT